MLPTFVYGTLMSNEVLQGLLGRVPTIISPAFLLGYHRFPVENQCFPGVVKSEDFSTLPDGKLLDDIFVSVSPEQLPIQCDNFPVVEGKLLVGLTTKEMEVLDWFEEVDIMYKRITVRVAVKEGHLASITWSHVDATAYVWLLGDEQKTQCVLNTSSKWCYNTFRDKNLKNYLLETVSKFRKDLDQLKTEMIDNSHEASSKQNL